VRLYSEEDFAARRPFTEPEILRTNLASVVLQMAAIGLGEVEDFPFLDPPDRRNIKDGVTLLEEIGALATPTDGDGPGPSEEQLTPSRRLTTVGRKLAKLPLDPRLGRMVLEASRLGCLEEVLVIASGLSVQDPRERPAEKREAAAALHSRFEDGTSDFVTYLNLWEYLDDRQRELSSGQFRRLCRKELISYQRSREWQDVHGQLAELCRQLGFSTPANAPRRDQGSNRTRGAAPLDRTAEAGRARLHQAILAGVATQVGAREGDRSDFAAPRGARFAIWPASVLAKKPPRWAMAAELVETGRLWGRVAAPIRPQWVENAASHLLKWTYSEPTWDPVRGEAYLVARATLYGLPVVAGRGVALAGMDPVGSREMFIRHGLVDGDWDGAPRFVAENLDALQSLRALLQRARRPDLMVGDDSLAQFYEDRLPAEATSGRAFEAWWRRQPADVRASLHARPEDLQGPARVDVDVAEFPDAWSSSGDGAPTLALHYNWEPGQQDDGVVVEVPLAEMGRLAEEGLEWQVPGLRQELVTALLRSLPKDVRRLLVPVPEHARDFVAKAGPEDGPLLPVLAWAMTEATGTRILARDFDWDKVPAYLRPTFSVVDESGQPLAQGKEIDGLLAALRPRLHQALQAAASASSIDWGPPSRRSSTWDFGQLPKVFEPDWHGYRLRGFPALVDEGDAVSVRVFADEASASLAMAAGTRRLLLLNLPARRALVDTLERQLDNRAKLALAGLRGLAYSSPRELAEDAVAAAVDLAVAANGGPAWDADSFATLVSAVRRDVDPQARKAMSAAARIISKLHELSGRLEQLRTRLAGTQLSLDDVASEVAFLAGPRLVSRAGVTRLPDIERYLTALERRLEKLPAEPRRDLGFTQRAQAAQRAVAEAVDVARQQSLSAAVVQQLEDLYWMVEELRVSLFAQSVGTKVPVSEERIGRAIGQLLALPPL
jgi:ATP-dependent helicase HrpA